LIAEKRDAKLDPLLSGYTPDKAKALRGLNLDASAIAREGLRWERLDQLMIEHLLGVA
jgi:hypothetical protein